jgi:hypothetical protein
MSSSSRSPPAAAPAVALRPADRKRRARRRTPAVTAGRRAHGDLEMLRGDLLRAKALGLNAYRLSVDWGNDEVERLARGRRGHPNHSTECSATRAFSKRSAT